MGSASGEPRSNASFATCRLASYSSYCYPQTGQNIPAAKFPTSLPFSDGQDRNYISVSVLLALLCSVPWSFGTLSYWFSEGSSPQSCSVTASASTEPSHSCSYKLVSSNIGREPTNKSVLKRKQTQEARQNSTAPPSTVGLKTG